MTLITALIFLSDLSLSKLLSPLPDQLKASPLASPKESLRRKPLTEQINEPCARSHRTIK